MRYAVVLEKAEANWAAYSPDVIGCIATGRTREETLTSFREALVFHLEGMRHHGEALPEPTSTVEYVEVDLPVGARP